VGRATKRYVRENDLTVRRGPFTGLRYPPHAVGTVTHLTTKLLGCYESALSPYLTDGGDFDLFVDVGAGDGYYCAGYKRLFPRTAVIGYETDASSRRMALGLAQHNGVDVEMRGKADHRALSMLPEGHLLLLSDVEGYEYKLLDPVAVPRLLKATMIIEVHPTARADIVEVLSRRFAVSHEITSVPGLPKDAGEFGELAAWAEDEARYAISEGRDSEPLWLVMRPRAA